MDSLKYVDLHSSHINFSILHARLIKSRTELLFLISWPFSNSLHFGAALYYLRSELRRVSIAFSIVPNEALALGGVFIAIDDLRDNSSDVALHGQAKNCLGSRRGFSATAITANDNQIDLMRRVA